MASVNRTLAKIFVQNERAEKKLTDTEILAIIQTRHRDTAITSAQDVRRQRYRYNKGFGVFRSGGVAGSTPEKPVSHEYDSEGNVVKSAPVNPELVTRVEGGLSEEQIRKIISEEVSKRPNIQVVVNDQVKVTFPAGTVHKKFKEALMKLSAGIPVMLVGPAGSGKTFLAEQLANAMGLNFTYNSMTAGVSESELLGRTLPDEKGNWHYQPAPFVITFRDGGLHLLDEMDASDANLLVKLNTALANRMLSLSFANGGKPIRQHKDCYVIAAANTYGNGADRQYVGRAQLDAATMNRFQDGIVEVDYDRDVERSIVTNILSDNLELAESLLAWGWRTREGIAAGKLRRIFSTRNLENQARKLRQGSDLNEVKSTYFAGWTADERKLVGA